MRSTLRQVFLLSFLFSVFSFLVPARANDSSASLGAGGIVLTENADIRMAREDLFISRAIVRVRYAFVNETGAPITTRVAFPMPDADLDALGESDVGWPKDDARNPIDFKVRVGGRSVRPELEIKAMLKGEDVTDVLKRLKLPLDHRVGVVLAALGKLPQSARAELARRGLTEGADDYVRPLWAIKRTFHWQQTFPAGRPLAVEHAYKPVVGGSFLPAVAFFEHGMLNEDWYKQFCIDETTRAGVAARLRAEQRRQGEGALLIQWVIDYVLTTGRNWKGPIGRFRLTLDKGRAQNLISLCMEGVRKTGPTTFVVERRDFEPDEDLHVMIFAPPER